LASRDFNGPVALDHVPCLNFLCSRLSGEMTFRFEQRRLLRLAP